MLPAAVPASHWTPILAGLLRRRRVAGWVPFRRWRRDFGHLQIDLTIDDPKAYTKPWTVKESATLLPDTEVLEYMCSENNRALEHPK